jgi:Ca2+-dependent lipid-binding protein
MPPDEVTFLILASLFSWAVVSVIISLASLFFRKP